MLFPSLLPAVNPVQGSVAGNTPGEGRTQLRQINVKGLTFSFIAVSKQPLQGEGGGLLSSCLSGYHLCFNLLFYFSKPDRGTLGCHFMLHFPFSPIAALPVSASSVKESVHGGLLSLVGCPIHPFQAGWLFLCTFSLPSAVMLSWLRLKRQVAKVKVLLL